MINGVKKNKLKVNISVCSLKREVKVKVTKFCVGWEELINAYKPTKQGIHVINGVRENKLKSITVCVPCSVKSRLPNFVLVENSTSLTCVPLMVCEKLS